MNTLLDFKKIEKISKALGDPYRLKIIEAIRKEPDWMQCSCIVNMLNLSQSAISHHIKQLVDADLLIAEKDGRKTKYTLNKEVFANYSAFISAYNQ
jgi:ArsR family transcriptional regulator, arsenate/arsenite/antimonite-responsive transcriptional repressor